MCQPHLRLHQKCKLRKEILSLYYPFMKHHLEYCIQLWRSQQKKDRDLLEQVQRRTTKIGRGLEYPSCEDRLREMCCLAYRRLCEELLQPSST